MSNQAEYEIKLFNPGNYKVKIAVYSSSKEGFKTVIFTYQVTGEVSQVYELLLSDRDVRKLIKDNNTIQQGVEGLALYIAMQERPNYVLH